MEKKDNVKGEFDRPHQMMYSCGSIGSGLGL